MTLLLLIHVCLPGGLIRARAQSSPNTGLVQFPSAGVEFIAGPQLRAGAEAMAVWFDANALERGDTHGARFPENPADIDADEYLNLNYYDQALCQYINYYRTGDARFLRYARKIADSWWRSVWIREGQQSVEESFAPRNASLTGLMLRAMDGRPEMWPWITDYTRTQFQLWVERPLNWNRALTDDQLAGRAPRQEGGQWVTRPAGFYYGVRDGGYMLLHAANLARVHPDMAVRNDLRARVLAAAVGYYGRLQALQPPADGGFYFYLEDFGIVGLTTQPFQEGILAEGLVAVHRLTGDERVKASIVRLAEHLYNRAYSKHGWRGFYYFVGGGFADGTACDPGCGAAANPFPPGDPSQVAEARQLNPTVLHTFGYAYLLTGEERFRQWGDEVFDSSFTGRDGYRSLASFRAKEYNEAYRSSGRYLAWRSGGSAGPLPTPTPAPTPGLPTTPPYEETLLSGRVFSGSAPLAGHRVVLYDARGDALGITRTDALGRYSFPVNIGQRGIVRPANRGSFTPSEYSFTISGNRSGLDFVSASHQSPGGATIRLKASSVSSTQINLDWSDNSTPDTSFQLERCRGAGCLNFRTIAVFSSNLTSYGNAGLEANTTYRYRVRANTGASTSSYSDIVQATTGP